MANGLDAPPLCDCHGEPKLWNRDKRKRAGGFWHCAVKNRERCNERSRREGRPIRGSAEHIANLRSAKVGKPHPSDCGHCAIGEDHPTWRGEDISTYGGAHHRHRKMLAGSPCAHADESCRGPVQCALRNEAASDHVRVDATIGLRFSPHTEDYMPLCASHHRRYDLANAAAV